MKVLGVLCAFLVIFTAGCGGGGGGNSAPPAHDTSAIITKAAIVHPPTAGYTLHILTVDGDAIAGYEQANTSDAKRIPVAGTISAGVHVLSSTSGIVRGFDGSGGYWGYGDALMFSPPLLWSGGSVTPVTNPAPDSYVRWQCGARGYLAAVYSQSPGSATDGCFLLNLATGQRQALSRFPLAVNASGLLASESQASDLYLGETKVGTLATNQAVLGVTDDGQTVVGKTVTGLSPTSSQEVPFLITGGHLQTLPLLSAAGGVTTVTCVSPAGDVAGFVNDGVNPLSPVIWPADQRGWVIDMAPVWAANTSLAGYLPGLIEALDGKGQAAASLSDGSVAVFTYSHHVF